MDAALPQSIKRSNPRAHQAILKGKSKKGLLGAMLEEPIGPGGILLEAGGGGGGGGGGPPAGGVPLAASSEAEIEESLDRCRKAFSQFDKAGNGVIRWAELHAALDDLGYHSTGCKHHPAGAAAKEAAASAATPAQLDRLMSPAEVTDDLINEADLKRDGLISFEEFVTLYQKLSALPGPAAEGGTSRWPGLFLLAVEKAESSLDAVAMQATVELATRHTYSLAEDRWVEEQVEVKLPAGRFINEGGCRDVYELYRKTKAGTWAKMVIKYEKDAQSRTLAENLVYVRQGVVMQELVRRLARQFNGRDPPVKIDVLEAAILSIPAGPDRAEGLVGAIEAYIEGEFVKYNDPGGYLVGLQQGFSTKGNRVRQTPLAFSHFSWHESGGQQLVADVQGVHDLYTDPQILSPEGKWGVRDDCWPNTPHHAVLIVHIADMDGFATPRPPGRRSTTAAPGSSGT
eukprot:SAG22_NODE_2064_length_3060_cov_3.006754_1_plen_457_part_00